MESSVVLELSFDLAGRQMSAVLRENTKTTTVTSSSDWRPACRVCLRRRRPETTPAGSKLRKDCCDTDDTDIDDDDDLDGPAEPYTADEMRNIFDVVATAGAGPAFHTTKSATLADLLQECASIPLVSTRRAGEV